jgi:hypothetical protein
MAPFHRDWNTPSGFGSHQRDGALQVRPHRSDGHLEDAADLLDVHVFAVSKDHDHPWLPG